MKVLRIEHEGLVLGGLSSGQAGRPGLLLLHGWPQSSRVYDQVLDELAQDHFVLALDLPGIGESHGALPSAEKAVLADLLVGAAERAGARSPLVVGFDVGGMIAYAAARDLGARIAGAIVMNTVIPGLSPWGQVLSDPRIWHFAFHALPELPELLVQGHQQAYFDFFVNALAGRREAVGEVYREAFASAYERPESLKAGFDWYRAMPADVSHNSRPKNFDTPVLYLRGDADGRTPDDYVAGMRAMGAQHVGGGVLRGSGEFSPLEVPAEFVRAVRDFARRCQRP
ncbi:alpha/beta fold hydrolase [Ideonella sp. YS5]|uniref:alpha/beta fold hydrolase n=1 Tax=Ideonella sp. YS5 TaxID=3453714 RepID=UPI003EEE094A